MRQYVSIYMRIFILKFIQAVLRFGRRQATPGERRIIALKHIIFASFLMSASFIVGFALVFFWWALQPRDAAGAISVFTIEKGETAVSVAQRLEEHGFIRSANVFRIVLFWRGDAGDIKPGVFEFSPAQLPVEIAARITGDAIPEKDMQVTIPEGFTIKQIDERLSQAGAIETGSLLAGSGTLLAYDFLPSCMNRRTEDDAEVCDVEYSDLEGYLFPDTYRLKPKSEAGVVVEKLLDNFDTKLSIPLRAEIAAQGRSVKDIIVVASIVEREVRSDVDKAIVAGIIWKRLSQNYPLQIDATVLYALELAGQEKAKGEGPTLEDLKLSSPYNTYVYTGLPPGPISNPGLASIEAAARPESSNYFYYLSANDGTTIFSRTLAEHNRAKRIYLR